MIDPLSSLSDLSPVAVVPVQFVINRLEREL
jgi:hypothetical protein